MKLSSGIIIVNSKNQILGCKPHGKTHNYVDIPKGHVEDDETPYDAAIRETNEETGLDMSGVSLTDCGQHGYLKDKNLHVFLCVYDIDDLSKLQCKSYYKNRYDNQLYPEIVSYEWIDEKDIDERFYLRLSPIIK
jgi:8-oxo-dGTP pyrophosphatase MutT (NUDIX family)